ncbi:hypothetical protein E3P99_00525 [Wallemia hederae]|uniref:Maltase n=1 Tax=Wallemia hederae TaxID=1540922 RepID=A0A4T0FUU2_9BASI|nr:hypothetical protein E3P99_00525 [Wallemia hederae]
MRTAAAAAALVTSALALNPLSADDYGQRIKPCPGYAVNAAQTEQTATGLKAHLQLADAACNAFGDDVQSLILEATYETKERLHVKIYDEEEQHFQVPEEIFERPQYDPDAALKDSADLKFEYSDAPFAFWISRRSTGDVLFDTRLSEIPAYEEPYQANDTSASVSVMPNHNLIFEPQYIQLSSALPQDANIYGLGEVVSPSYRRNSSYTRQSNWASDIGTPTDTPIYGNHPFYIENRVVDDKSYNHGVFLLSTNGLETWLRDGVLQQRAIGGILEYYFLSGGAGENKPADVIRNYSEVVGKPYLAPYWALGFGLTRYGYTNDSHFESIIDAMWDAELPQETAFIDIDFFKDKRDWTVDEVSFGRLREIVDKLHERGQKFVPIHDNAIPITRNESDVYDYYTEGHEQDVFIKNQNGTEYIGQVWPGYTVFPDPYAANASKWWTESFKKFHEQIPFDSIWMDMNEASSFSSGSMNGLGPLEPNKASIPEFWPEGYDNNTSGNSGNITVDGRLTYMQKATEEHQSRRHMLRRGMGTFETVDEDLEKLTFPPYQIHVGTPDKFYTLGHNTVSANATHQNGYHEYDVHNANGHMINKMTREAVEAIYGGDRSFILARSTFAGSGKYANHWLGDNYSTWQSMRDSIKGLFQFSAFQIPFVGADACGFGGNTNEELCTRWMMLASMTPFYRNHNTFGAIPQEPYRWETTAAATKKATHTRYQLLPYLYSNLYKQSVDGTPFIRPLFYEFPTYSELLDWDYQFVVGDHLLVSPALFPNVSTVDAYFPGDEPYYDWLSHKKQDVADERSTVTLDAELTDINVHIRGGAVFILHSEPGMTVTETTETPFHAVIALNKNGAAGQDYYFDDGHSPLGEAVTHVQFDASTSGVQSVVDSNTYSIGQPLNNVDILGWDGEPPSSVTNGDAQVEFEYNADSQTLSLHSLNHSLNENLNITFA